VTALREETKLMSKKRAGWEAVDNLVALDDVRKWVKVEMHWDGAISDILPLRGHQTALEEMGSVKEFFTKDDLDKIIKWKHTVGKTRVFNVKYINANSDSTVRHHSRLAISLAMKIQLDECLDENGTLTAKGKKSIQDAIVELSKNLKGVGPATASAMLTLVRPDIFCYMYDEAIDCFGTKRDYTIAYYMRVNGRCLDIAKQLGEGWTTNRVAKTIWTAARSLAVNGKDLTEGDDSGDDEEEDSEEAEDGEEQEEEEDDDNNDGDDDEEDGNDDGGGSKKGNGNEGSGPPKRQRVDDV
jgi:hypothetical protein